MGNYSPASVLFVVARVFERLTYDQLPAHIEKHNFLSKYQSGFRKISFNCYRHVAKHGRPMLLNMDKDLILGLYFLS